VYHHDQRGFICRQGDDMKKWIAALGACAALSTLPMGAFAHDNVGNAALGGLIGGVVGGLIGAGGVPVYVAPAPVVVAPAPVVVERYAPAPVVIERYPRPVVVHEVGPRWHGHKEWHKGGWRRHHRRHRD
jgi:hypothetical protein